MVLQLQFSTIKLNKAERPNEMLDQELPQVSEMAEPEFRDSDLCHQLGRVERRSWGGE